MSQKTCFVIAPIGEPDSETRKRSDDVFDFIIKPVVKDCGYAEPFRGDHLPEPGMITNQVIQHLLKDDLVIADLTESNPNVFYELAVRHTIRKPIVQMIRRGERIPFDVSGMRTVYYDIHDFRFTDETKKELAGHIQSVEQTPENAESPIAAVLNLEALQSSSNPEKRSLAELLSAIAEIKSLLADMKP